MHSQTSDDATQLKSKSSSHNNVFDINLAMSGGFQSDSESEKSTSDSPGLSPTASPSPLSLDDDKIEIVSTWIEQLLCEERPRTMDFFAWLRDGQILCEVVQKLDPDSIPKINYSPRVQKQQENIELYLSVCRRHRIFPIFLCDDLFHSQNLSLVLANTYTLYLSCLPPESASSSSSSSASSVGRTASPSRQRSSTASPSRQAQHQHQHQLQHQHKTPIKQKSLSASQRSTEPIDQLKELSRWVLSTIKQSDPTQDFVPPDTDDSFYELFSDGSLLCNLCNALRPGTIARIDSCPVPMSLASSIQKFRAIDNLERYLLACRTVFGLAEEECFVPGQLCDRKDLGRVLTNIFALRTHINRTSSTPDVSTPIARRHRTAKIEEPAQTAKRSSSPKRRLREKAASPRRHRSATTMLNSPASPPPPLSVMTTPNPLTQSPTITSQPSSPSASPTTPMAKTKMLDTLTMHRERSQSTSRSRSGVGSYKLMYPAHYAAKKGYIQRIRSLPEETLRTLDGRQRYPLHVAASENNVEIIEYLCQKNPGHLEATEQQQNTPLLLACSVSAFSACKWLLLNGANPCAVNQAGLSPCHYLAKLSTSRERDSLWKLLISHGGNVDTRDAFGETPLFYATSHLSVSTMKFLGKRGASFLLQNQFGETLLHKACRLLDSSPKSARTIITLLLERNVDPLVEGAHGTALSLVSEAKHPDVRQQLIDAMSKPSASRRPWHREVSLSISLEHLKNTSQLDGMQKIEELARLAGEAYVRGSGDEENPDGAQPGTSGGVEEEEDHWLLRLPTTFAEDDSEADDEEEKKRKAAEERRAAAAASSMTEVRPAPTLHTVIEKPIVEACEGYRVEDGSESAKKGVYKPNCGYLKMLPKPYQLFFFGRIHTTFLGFLASGKPFIASILDNPTGASPDRCPTYQALLRTPTVEKTFWLPLASSKGKSDKMKQLLCLLLEKQQCPEVFNRATFFPLPSEKTQTELATLENQDPIRSTCFPIGVVYAKKDQTTQWDMWANEEGSPAWDRFLALLGNQVTLRGWSGYSGGLDTHSDSKGKYSVFTDFEHLSIMFHVSTMLPFDPLDKQKLQRSRVIGNDVAMIIFQEDPGTTYIPSCMTGQVSHVFIVVRPVTLADGSQAYEVGCASKDFVAEFKPRIPSPNIIPEQEIKKWLLNKLINGFVCAQQSPGLSMMYCRPRQHLMTDLITSLAPQASNHFSFKYDPVKKGSIKKQSSFIQPSK